MSGFLKMIYTDKLKKGDTIRVITPARSLSMGFINAVKNESKSRLENMGFKVTFGKHVYEMDEFDSSPIKNRIEDLHDAFLDKDVKLILTVIGGYNSGELLEHIDYDIIKNNPKKLCGYSDITALQNAIYAKTGLVTYSGLHFFDFAELKNFEYAQDYFKKCMFLDKDESYEIKPSDKYSYDKWGLDQINRNFIKNKGYEILNEGYAEGTILGSNLVTFHSLQGTEYSPKFKDSVLFLEEDCEEHIYSFARNLNSITMRDDFCNVKGIVFGRMDTKSGITKKLVKKIIDSNEKLSKIPIIWNTDFGHTTPRLTFPIGGIARFNAKNNNVKLEILKH
jgi:muramoyltetrapeptide carboxypeptidase